MLVNRMHMSGQEAPGPPARRNGVSSHSTSTPGRARSPARRNGPNSISHGHNPPDGGLWFFPTSKRLPHESPGLVKALLHIVPVHHIPPGFDV